MLAVSGEGSTATAGRRLCGLIIPNPTRKIPYASNTPNAIEPTAAHTNINKFNKSAINLSSVYCTKFATFLHIFSICMTYAMLSGTNLAILSEKAAR
jgi:hypothetical protein